MFDALRNANYLASLKWKQGEAKALSTFRGSRADLIVHFTMPPAGDFEYDLGRPAEPTEHIRRFGPKLKQIYGRQGVFIDAGLVDDARHKDGLSVHPLTELLERARVSGALAFPVTGLGRSAEYQAAIARFIRTSPDHPVCIRIAAGDRLDEFGDVIRDLRLLVFELGIKPDQVLLNFDLGSQEPYDPAGFARLLRERINLIPNLHNWLNIAVTLTSFPSEFRLKPGQVGRYPRSDWEVYKRLAGDTQLLRIPIFGDYAVEFPKFPSPKIGISPSAHLRVTTSDDYVVSKGPTTKGNGYEAIFPVAQAMVLEHGYPGPGYSAGEGYMTNLATAPARTGNASTWRWAATDIHLTRVTADLRALKGQEVLALAGQEPEQLQLV
jgi:hypothetical protein